jgi:hypothetical protein
MRYSSLVAPCDKEEAINQKSLKHTKLSRMVFARLSAFRRTRAH